MRFFPALALLVCLLGACARTVGVEVNSFVEHGEAQEAGRLEGRRCLVLPAKADLSPDDLQFREFAAQLSASLARKGCEPAQGLEDADLAVSLAYGIGEPLIVEQRGYVVHRPWGRWGRAMPDYLPVTTTYIFNTCSLRLEARLVEKAAAPSAGAKQGGAPSGPRAEDGARPGRQVWKLEAAHVGQQSDLRLLFPWLLAAAGEYYGVDSGRTILVSVGAENVLSAPPPARNAASPPGAKP
ncbi:MAG: hypothetical protein LBC79_00590 [Deltaproteobacteria bacterium]|jgi:hypothetical protein|nr:hypothetical protein [Deltaproteobacteria bacterium]